MGLILKVMVQTNGSRSLGIGRVLVVVYAILALGATGRSVYQIATQFDLAPLAYILSAVSGVVYIVATIALVAPGRSWYWTAWVTITFEFVGVVVVGFLTVFDPALFPKPTVWSDFGNGYYFVPLVLPILGMLWLRRRGVPMEHSAADADSGVVPLETSS